jgi:hypothetical protein
VTNVILPPDFHQFNSAVSTRNLWYNKTKDMRFFALTFDKVIIRFFLMMALIIGGLFAGQPLIALLALPLFLSAMLGVSFLPEPKETAVKTMVENNTMTKQAA